MFGRGKGTADEKMKDMKEEIHDKTRAAKENLEDKMRAGREAAHDTVRENKQWVHDVSKGAKEILEDDARALKERMHGRKREAKDEYRGVTTAAKDKLHAANEAIVEKAKEIGSAIHDKTLGAKEAIHDKAVEAKEAMHDKTKALADKTHHLVDYRAHDAKNAAHNAVRDAKNAAHNTAQAVKGQEVVPHTHLTPTHTSNSNNNSISSSSNNSNTRGNNTHNKSKTEQLLSDFVTGGVIGAVTKTALAPVERVKLLLQTQASHPEVLSGKEKAYTSIMDCVNRVRAEQGMKAFWRGNLVNCLRYAPQQGSALAFNDFLNNVFPRYDDDAVKRFGVKLGSGGLAGAISATLTYPFDYARTRLASDVRAGEGQFKGITDCLKTTVQQQGIVGLYRGWAVTVGGAFVYRAGQLGLFRYIQDMNPYAKDKGALGAVSSFCAVTAARTAVMPLNYPFDTIRRRLMLESEKPKGQRRYSSGVDCFKQVVAKEGVVGLYKGMVPELFRGVGGSLVVVAYDRVKYIFGI